MWTCHMCSLASSPCGSLSAQAHCTAASNVTLLLPPLSPQLCWQARLWECSTCGTGRDAAAVEALLISEVAAQTRAYQLQDLKCLKCRQVGCADMSQLPAAPHYRSIARMSLASAKHCTAVRLTCAVTALERVQHSTRAPMPRPLWHRPVTRRSFRG